ncbi:1-phosphofructokinase [Paenibacillus larvae]|uniref:1-phosphofructokinase n=1 Tax=Paenibacillus larvae TaxID=1464 RepID=UPI0023A9A9AB|nr:1-phosphofructokinase [Paenibacillus larvae]MDE5125424.1 1-phosphofructokinase [Paenibacillus larvae subsp. larvae]MDE5134253.1 1-phosphofructokinase [Paenibacillus larvae subsp. larvae]MDE5138325.1 1-phosphofructokinase [Paenibacillus larvae subsp. larvae]MDE5142360.1 1-phosphofructokinase [Paenibacillus larvae subsp. larvae]MDE5150139.1 1-phosphofructokinase [Paenibacillus larvae subsp. larvae]
MITTVTLNAAVDKTYQVPEFREGSLHRIPEMSMLAGGKGNNVARVTATLGEPVIATGFLAGHTGKLIEKLLEEDGIRHEYMFVPGESRTCITIVDPRNSRQTELLESGPVIQEEHLNKMKQKIRQLAVRSSFVIFSGSLPSGCSPSAYVDLIRTAKEEGARVILDTSGEALEQSLAGLPDLIKPNEHEVAKLAGRSISSEVDILTSITSLNQRGIRHVVVSLGDNGALAGIDGSLYRVHLPKINMVNAVGSGDSMVAGMAIALMKEYSPEEVLKLGCACGSANALHMQAGRVQADEVYELQANIKVERLN